MTIASIVGSADTASARSPAAVRTGMDRADFNGDGYSDLAVGSYGESLPGIKSAGAVSVVYGSATGLTSDGNQFFTADSPGIAGSGAQTGGAFGRTVAAGLFNSDGYADLAIGAYGMDVDDVADAGAVYVLFGSAAGLTTTGSQFWTQDSLGMAGDGAEDFDRFGHYLGVGDFNGDGVDDLAAGSDWEDVGTVVDTGSTTVMYGSPNGGLTTFHSQWWMAANPRMAGVGAQTDAAMGRSYTSGDFNADGYADLVITVYLEDVDGIHDAGAVHVLYGSSGGLQVLGGAVAPDDQYWTENTPGMSGDGAEIGDNWGRQPAAGDFNADGYDDLAIGATQEGVGDKPQAGAFTELFGSATGLTLAGNTWFTQDTPGMAGAGAQAWDQMGRADVTGDFNGDGYADLAIGTFGETVNTNRSAGSVNVAYGSATGLTTTRSQYWTQDSPGVKDESEPDDEFGKGLGMGDFNADGSADLTIGVYWEDVRSVLNAGIVDVLYGITTRGLQATDPDDQILVQGHNGLLDDTEKGDRFGWIFG
jgi:hypothetical protein